MKRKYRKWTEKEKAVVVGYAFATGVSAACKKYAVARMCVHRWAAAQGVRFMRRPRRWGLYGSPEYKAAKAAYDLGYNKRHRAALSAYNLVYIKARKAADPAFRLLYNARCRISSALKRGKKMGRTLALVGCTLAELKAHLEGQFVSGMSWGNYGRGGWDVDHIIPCIAFDLTKEAQQRECFHWTNLQPLWHADNQSKYINT